MDGMAMDGMAMGTATAAATATNSASSVIAALETSSAALPAADSSSMSMQAMPSSVHFGLGDPFFASFLTPVNSTGYVAILFLLMMLSFLQRGLSLLSNKADHNWELPERTEHQAELEVGSGSWMEKDEAKQLTLRSPNKVIGSKVSLLIGRSMLQVLSAAVGYLIMLGVMTLNAGYIIALLVGVFAGELLFGRHRLSTAH
ncbi:Ctr copper transporter family-domain-containing protein [Cadophora sp. MPI-SDFR-AT-0126]|nr:Ctr copper transporter family-domain-containing protein [Leotiomycetes sp. MPI-SDFR-AT-0126]